MERPKRGLSAFGAACPARRACPRNPASRTGPQARPPARQPSGRRRRTARKRNFAGRDWRAISGIVAETAGRRLLRLWLAGDRAGTSEVVAELPGFPDNLGADDDGNVWVAFASEPNPALESLHKLPLFLRRLAARLPESVLPKPSRVAWILGLRRARRVRARLQMDGRRLCDGDRRLPRRPPHLVQRLSGGARPELTRDGSAWERHFLFEAALATAKSARDGRGGARAMA